MLSLLLLCSPALAPQDLQGHYRFEDGVPGQVATGVGTLSDSSPLAAHGTPHGEPHYVADAPGWCAGNGLALELDGVDDYLEFDSTFVFHAPFGDATLEFSARVPDPGVHTNVFWTTKDLGGDSNRFHLSVNAGGALHLDYRTGPGSLVTILPADGSLTLDDDVWTNVAIVRQVLGSGDHEYRFYKNGALATVRIDLAPQLPNAIGWTIAGRESPPHNKVMGLIDEVRLHSRALAPYEFVFANLVEPYCGPASPNSVSADGATLSAVGCPSLGANGFGVAAEGLPPGVIGVLAVGQQQAQVPFGNGVLCVGGTVQRVGPAFADAQGQVSIPIDLAGPLSIGNGVQPGDQRFLQLWYRDPVAPPAGFNLSDALAVTFAP